MAKSESRKPSKRPVKKLAAKKAGAPEPKPAAAKPVAKQKAPPLDERLLAILGRDAARSLSAPEIARLIAPDDWHALLAPIRHAAVKLMLAGELVIYRKGKAVDDPEDFRGVYRLGLPKGD